MRYAPLLLAAQVALCGLSSTTVAAEKERYGRLNFKVVITGTSTTRGALRNETSINRTFTGTARMRFSSLGLAPGDQVKKGNWTQMDAGDPPPHLPAPINGPQTPGAVPDGMMDFVKKCAGAASPRACMAEEARKRCTDEKNEKMCAVAENMGKPKTKFDIVEGSNRDRGDLPPYPDPVRSMEHWVVESCQLKADIAESGTNTMGFDPAVGGQRRDGFTVKGQMSSEVLRGGACYLGLTIDRRNKVGNVSWRMPPSVPVETVVKSPLASANSRWSKPTNIFNGMPGFSQGSYRVENASGVSANGFSGSKTFASTPNVSGSGTSLAANAIVTWTFTAE